MPPCFGKTFDGRWILKSWSAKKLEINRESFALDHGLISFELGGHSELEAVLPGRNIILWMVIFLDFHGI